MVVWDGGNLSILEAAGEISNNVFVMGHPEVSYSAMGYEMCRTDYEYFECKGPGRMTTVDFQENKVVTLSLQTTPIESWAPTIVTFAVSRGLNHSQMVEWIDSFVDLQHPDLVMITGRGAGKAFAQQVIEDSKATSLVIDQSSIPVDKAAVMGAAQTAKEVQESQFGGCWESDECEAVRREADRIAGKFNPPSSPSRWPAAILRNQHYPHDEL